MVDTLPMVEGLEKNDITPIGIGIVVVLVVLGFILLLALSGILIRLVIVVVVVGLAFLVYQQRQSIENKVNKSDCNLNATFFGIHVDPPLDVSKACRTATR